VIEQAETDHGRVGMGERLRRAREARGWTLRDVSERIKVTRATIEELENDYVSFHDAGVYLRGYRQNYARLLGVRMEKKAPGTLPVQQLAAIRLTPRGNRIRTVMEGYSQAATYLLATALVVLSVVAWFQKPLSVEKSANVALIQGQSADHPTSVVQDQGPSEPIPAPLQALPAALTPLHLGGVQSPSLLDADRANSTPNTEPSAGGWSHLTLAADADCWVEITDASGRRIEYDLFRAGERREYRALGQLHVLLGNASAITMTVNDKHFDQRPFVNNNLASFNLDLDSGS